MSKIIQIAGDFLYKILLFVFDTGTMMFCFWLGLQFRAGSTMASNSGIDTAGWMHIFLFVAVIDGALIWGGTYNIHKIIAHVVWLKETIKFAMFGFWLALSIGYLSRILVLEWYQAIVTFAILVPAILMERTVVDKLWGLFRMNSGFVRKIVIYGAGSIGKRLARSIEKNPKLGYHAIAFFSDEKAQGVPAASNPLPVFGGEKEFSDFLKTKGNSIDEVFIAMPTASNKKISHIMTLCDAHSIPYKLVPSYYDLKLHRIDQQQLDGIPLLSTKEMVIPPWNRLVKRLFDISGSLFFMTAAAPLMAVFAMLIRKSSPGPVLFRQKRVGLKGKEFKMYKFRTMYVDTPKYDLHPSKTDDPRITPVGRFLRKTSFDELPQFWNVLRGDMSIVGPRPEMPFIVKKYNEYHKERLNVKPGITGLWQISGDRSLPIHENIDHDLYYITHQSLLLDFVVVLNTIWFALIRGVGAK